MSALRPFRIFAAVLLFVAPAAQPAATDLRARFEQIAASAQGRVGASILLLETGESVSLGGDGRFPMQSVYKLPIAMAVLHRVDRGALQLEQRVRVEPKDFVSAGQHSPVRDQHPQGTELSLQELLRLNVSESDGTACDVLLDLIGGTAAVAEHLHGLGIAGIAVVDTEKEIGRDHSLQYRNWATPDAAVALLRKLHQGARLSAGSRALLLRMMTESPTGLRRLRGLLPPGTVVAHKTGSSGMENGLAAATNDIGIVTLPDGRHLAIAVFVSDSKADEATREGVIAKIARAAWDAHSDPTRNPDSPRTTARPPGTTSHLERRRAVTGRRRPAAADAAPTPRTPRRCEVATGHIRGRRLVLSGGGPSSGNDGSSQADNAPYPRRTGRCPRIWAVVR